MRTILKNSLIKILGLEYRLLKAFYSEVREDNAQYAIFVTRRCFILYHLISYVEMWETLNKPILISDRGIWFNRVGLSNATKVLVIDDILWYGRTISSIIIKLKKYTDENCEIISKVYCMFEEATEDKINRDIGYWCLKDRYSCNLLSDSFVRCITENGIPYSTFIYPWYGKINHAYIDNLNNRECHKIVKIHPLDISDKALTQYYDFDLPENIQNVLSNFSYASCLRVYHKEIDSGSSYSCVMPFCFVNDIKKERVNDFFKNLLLVLKDSEEKVLSHEIEISLNDNNEIHKEDKWVYLMTIFSCLLSRYIGIEMKLNNLFYEDYHKDIAEIAIQGSFPENVTKAFISLDENFAIKFSKRINNIKESWSDYFNVGTPILYEDIKWDNNTLISEISCIDATINLFQNKRMKYDVSRSEKDKFISCSDIFSQLHTYNPYEIYASLISCWDQGIAGYVFKYYDDKGIVSINGIGERSALILSLRYYKSLEKYFVWEIEQAREKKKLNAEQKKQQLETILKCDNVKKDDRTILLNDINILYQYYLL